jgi:hypothetical protein
MHHMSKTISPPTPRPRTKRLSVPISEELLQTFQRMGKAQGQGAGAAIAEWLEDTSEAAEFMALKLEQARAAPKVVMREMHAYALGLADETGQLVRQLQEKGRKARAVDTNTAAFDVARACVAGGVAGGDRGDTVGHGGALTGGGDAGASHIPPSCNTGGKLPRKPKKVAGLDLKFPLPPAKVQAYADTNGVPPKAVK